ncbi:MAG: hypothetical protein ACI9JN_002578 [Bacteroidia bacterium]|jgi:hypothetical protein
MKLFKSKTKRKTIGIFTLLMASSFSLMAQGPTSSGYALESCYHLLSPSAANPSLNVLNLGDFEFKYSSNAGAQPDHIRIKMYDQLGEFMGYNYHSIGIADDMFPVIAHPDHGIVVAANAFDVGSGLWVLNRNTFRFPEEVTRVEITTFHWTGDAGSKTLDPSNRKLTLNLLNGEQAFTLEPTNGSCFTFDNFHMKYSHILDGFCGYLSDPVLTLAPPPPNGSGWNDQFTQDIDFNRSIQISQPQWQGGASWCDDECQNATSPYYITQPVTCGCVDFTVKLVLSPCPTSSENCPPLNLELPLKICCDCDIRETPPQY